MRLIVLDFYPLVMVLFQGKSLISYFPMFQSYSQIISIPQLLIVYETLSSKTKGSLRNGIYNCIQSKWESQPSEVIRSIIYRRMESECSNSYVHSIMDSSFSFRSMKTQFLLQRVQSNESNLECRSIYSHFSIGIILITLFSKTFNSHCLRMGMKLKK